MRQITIHGPNDVRMDNVPEPVLGAKDVLLKVLACGVCGTDLTFIKLGGTGIPGQASPLPLGHEASGEVLAVGRDVADIRIGERVILNPMGSLHVIGNGGPEGAFCDILLVRDAKWKINLYPVPEGMPMHLAALTEPLGVAMHGVNRAAPGVDDKCVVFGVGPIGLAAVLWLKRRGVKDIVAVDVSVARLPKAREVGATATIAVDKDDLRQRLSELHGSEQTIVGTAVGSDIFFDFAGAPSVINDVIDLAKTGATLLMVAIHPIPRDVDFSRVVVKELTVLGSCGYPEEYPRVIEELVAMGGEAEKLVSHRISFSRFMEAIDAARSPDSAKVMVEFS